MAAFVADVAKYTIKLKTDIEWQVKPGHMHIYPLKDKSDYFMKHIVLKNEPKNSMIAELLKFYTSLHINTDVNYETLSNAAKDFLNGYQHSNSTNSLSDIDFSALQFNYPKDFTEADKYDFKFEFQNFYIVVKNCIDRYTPSFINLETERQASPQKQVFDPVGHNREVNVTKMKYSYLFD